MANAFEPKTTIPLKKKEFAQKQKATEKRDEFKLPGPSPKRKQCCLYLSVDMMDRVRRIARREGITIGAVIEACVEMALEQMGE